MGLFDNPWLQGGFDTSGIGGGYGNTSAPAAVNSVVDALGVPGTLASAYPFAKSVGALGRGAAAAGRFTSGGMGRALISAPLKVGSAGLGAFLYGMGDGQGNMTTATDNNPDIYVRDPKTGRMVLNTIGANAPMPMPGDGPTPTPQQAPAPPQAGAAGGPPSSPPSPSPGAGGPPTGLQASFPFTGAYSPQSLSSSMAFPQVKPPAGGDTPMPTPRPQGAGVPAMPAGAQTTDGNGYTSTAPSYYNGPGSMNFGAGDQAPGLGFGRDSGNTSKGGGLLSKFLAGLAGTNHNGIFGLFNGPQPQFASGASRVGVPTNRPFVNPDASRQYAGLFGNSMPTDI